MDNAIQGIPFSRSFILARKHPKRVPERAIGLSQGLYLHKTRETREKSKNTSIPLVEFEPTIPVFEKHSTVHAIHCAAFVICYY
jgi:hypothetical protein